MYHQNIQGLFIDVCFSCSCLHSCIYFVIITLYGAILLQEYEIDKTLGIKGPEDVAKMGIEAYNAECRKIVMRYSHEWEVRLLAKRIH